MRRPVFAELTQMAREQAQHQPTPGSARPLQSAGAEGDSDDDTDAARRADARGSATGGRGSQRSKHHGGGYKERRKQTRLVLQGAIAEQQTKTREQRWPPRDPDSGDSDTQQ
jgi:hypothetical protein